MDGEQAPGACAKSHQALQGSVGPPRRIVPSPGKYADLRRNSKTSLPRKWFVFVNPSRLNAVDRPLNSADSCEVKGSMEYVVTRMPPGIGIHGTVQRPASGPVVVAFRP